MNEVKKSNVSKKKDRGFWEDKNKNRHSKTPNAMPLFNIFKNTSL